MCANSLLSMFVLDIIYYQDEIKVTWVHESATVLSLIMGTDWLTYSTGLAVPKVAVFLQNP